MEKWMIYQIYGDTDINWYIINNELCPFDNDVRNKYRCPCFGCNFNSEDKALLDTHLSTSHLNFRFGQ